MSSPTVTEERIVVELGGEQELATLIVALATFAGSKRDHPTRRTEHADAMVRRMMRGTGVHPNPLRR